MTLLDFLKTQFITPFPVPLAVIVFLTIFQPVVFRFNRCFSSSFFNCQETKATWHSADHCGILLAFLGIVVRVILKLVIMKAKTQNTPRLHCNVIGDPKTIAHISHNRHNRQWRTFFKQKKAKVDHFFKVIPSLY